MTARVPDQAAPAVTQIREQFAWLPKVLQVAAVPVMALLWWALAFLPWTSAAVPPLGAWPPTLPVLFTDLVVAGFGSLGASLVVVALLRRGGLALVAVLLGLGVPAWVTLTRPDVSVGRAVGLTERQIVLVVCVVAALVGLGLGAAAIRSSQAFGFLGLLAVLPVVELISVLLLDPLTDNRWLTRSALALLLVMIAWRRWTGVLVWPIFFALWWLLNLGMSTVGYGAQTLRHPGGGQASVRSVAEAMLDFVPSAWRIWLENSWGLFWPAALIAALVVGGIVVAGLLGWRKTRQAGRSPE